MFQRLVYVRRLQQQPPPHLLSIYLSTEPYPAAPRSRAAAASPAVGHQHNMLKHQAGSINSRNEGWRMCSRTF